MRLKSILLGIILTGTALFMAATGPAAETLRPTWCVAYKGMEKGPRAEKMVTFAAKELAGYMSRVLGAEVPVAAWPKAEAPNVLLITDAANAPADIARELTGKKLDAFLIRYPVEVDGRKVCLLVSHDDWGYDFPVYHFLTKYMDVHWVGPGELGQVVPRNSSWRMPDRIEVLDQPDLEMRYWNNGPFSCRPWGAGSLRMDFHHALGAVFHPSKFGKSDPDVYPLVEGKRYIPPAEAVHTADWQPCTGNPRTVELAAEYVLKRFKEEPHLLSVSLSVNDGAANYCMCDRCRADDAPDAFANPSDTPKLSTRFFKFYNRVAERVVRQNPNAYIAVLGYGPYAGQPPAGLKLHPNLVVFEAHAPTDRWAKLGAKTANYNYLYEAGYFLLRNYPHMLADTVRTLKRNNGMGFYAEAYGPWAGNAAKFYVLSHLLWNADSDVDRLMDDFVRLSYGPKAAPAMRRYFDKWEEIYERGPREARFDVIQNWRSTSQFENFRRTDLRSLDGFLAEAAAAEMTPDQRARLEILGRHHEWLRLNLEQHLFTRDLRDRGWLVARGDDAALGEMAQRVDLTDRVDRIWKETISTDKTGWFLPAHYVGRADGYYKGFLENLRNQLASDHETAMDDFADGLTARWVLSGSKEKAAERWRAALAKSSSLAPFIEPQLRSLKGEPSPNLVPNGGFEKGSEGNPPKLPGWKFYQEFGAVKGVPPNYTWKTGAGRDGGRAVGVLEGLYEELQTLPIALEAGRYRYSYWVRTVGRKYTTTFWLLRCEPGGSSRSVMVFCEPPTDGQWRRITRTFTLPQAGDYILQFSSSWQDKGYETYFDDVELTRLR